MQHYKSIKKEEIKISEENPNFILNDNNNSNNKHEEYNSHFAIYNQGNNVNNSYLFNKQIMGAYKSKFKI